MSEYSEFYRSITSIGLAARAWEGNLLDYGDDKADFISDGHTILRREACNDDRIAGRSLTRRHAFRSVSQDRARVLLERIGEAVGRPASVVRMGTSGTTGTAVIGVRSDQHTASFDGQKVRLAAYVTHADDLTLLVGDWSADFEKDAPVAVLWRDGEVVASVMGLRRDAPIEWEDAV